jgi:hypothetical protein
MLATVHTGMLATVHTGMPATVRTGKFCLPVRYQKYKDINAHNYNLLLLYSGVKLGLSHYGKNISWWCSRRGR